MTKPRFLHKGYGGTTEVSIEDGCLHGRVIDINDMITYEGLTVPELLADFIRSVDAYLAHCKKIGKSPNKPFTGSLNVRLEPSQHRDLSMHAQQAGTSINDLIKVAVSEFLIAQSGVQCAAPVTAVVATNFIEQSAVATSSGYMTITTDHAKHHATQH